MALSVVRGDGNRVIAAYAESADANTAAGAQSGTSVVTLTDSQQGTETRGSIIGKVVSDAGVVSAYVRRGNALRDYRRNQCYDLIADGLASVPSVSAEEDSDATGVIHKYLRHCFAAAATDSNMTNPMRFGEVESACKGGDLKQGMPEFFRVIVTDATARAAWNTALAPGVRVLSSPTASGGVSAKSATLPSDWATNAAYHAVQAVARD